MTRPASRRASGFSMVITTILFFLGLPFVKALAEDEPCVGCASSSNVSSGQGYGTVFEVSLDYLSVQSGVCLGIRPNCFVEAPCQWAYSLVATRLDGSKDPFLWQGTGNNGRSLGDRIELFSGLGSPPASSSIACGSAGFINIQVGEAFWQLTASCTRCQ